MAAQALPQRIDALVRELAQVHGYRTLWIDLHGNLVHAEPDEEHEGRGYVYVATLMRPDVDTIREAVARHVSLAPAPSAPSPWVAPEAALATLVPA